MTRMMKIVPARRVVTDASPEPPNIDRSRAITPAGGAVADGASRAATAENPSGTAWCDHHPAYQPFVKIRSLGVVPAKAGTHSPWRLLVRRALVALPKSESSPYGSRPSPGRREATPN